MDSVTIIKFVSLLLYPLGLVFLTVAFGCIAFLRKNHTWAKRLWVSAFLLLWVGSTPKVAIWLTAKLEGQNPPQQVTDYQKHDFIIVLGGGLRLPADPVKRVPFTGATDRYWLASKLYFAEKAPQIVLLGGNVYPQTGLKAEAEFARDLLHEWGVPQYDIVVETSSRTTEQNVSQLRQKLMLLTKSRNGQVDNSVGTPELDSGVESLKLLVVTSALHMPRTLFLLNQEFGDSVSLTAASADVLIRQDATPEFKFWLPDAGAMHLLTLAVHEVYGRWFVQIKGWLEF